jgi:REP element-mobilizing transposase RayT
MDNEKGKPRRKELRIKQYDYSSKGAYFITVCIKDRAQILSAIINPVGVGALDDPEIRLTQIGRIVEKYLLSSENISGVTIDKYVIMPDHIHAIIFLDPNKYIDQAFGSSRAPTPTDLCVTDKSDQKSGKHLTPPNEMLPHIISTFKRFCNKEIGCNIFQRGYIEHIIRDIEDYRTRVKYICENPLRWIYREMSNQEKKL